MVRQAQGGARGERTIEVGERVYPILFTNRAIAEAERAVGKSIIAMAQDFSTGGTGMNEVGHLLFVGMEHGRRDARTGGKQYSMNDAWRVMDAVGFATAAATVFEAVTEVLSYGAGDEFDEDDEADP